MDEENRIYIKIVPTRYPNLIRLITTSSILSFNRNTMNTDIEDLKVWYKIKRRITGGYNLKYYIKVYIKYKMYINDKPHGKRKKSLIVNKYFPFKEKNTAALDGMRIIEMIHDAIENKQEEDH